MNKEDPEELEQWLLARREIDPQTECWRFTGAITGDGYGSLKIGDRSRYVHRVAAVLYLDLDASTTLFVLHRCDQRECFNPDHLFLGTHTDNMRDATMKGRTAKKLSPTQVGEIKYRLRTGETQKSIALGYGVTTSTIGQIAREETWKHIATPDTDPRECG